MLLVKRQDLTWEDTEEFYRKYNLTQSCKQKCKLCRIALLETSRFPIRILDFSIIKSSFRAKGFWKNRNVRPTLIPPFSRLWSKSAKKSVRRGVRACEAREKKNTAVRFPYEFVPTRGFKNVVELSKICSQPHPLCEFDILGDWFRGRIARVIVYTWLRIFRCIQ